MANEKLPNDKIQDDTIQGQGNYDAAREYDEKAEKVGKAPPRH